MKYGIIFVAALSLLSASFAARTNHKSRAKSLLRNKHKVQYTVSPTISTSLSDSESITPLTEDSNNYLFSNDTFFSPKTSNYLSNLETDFEKGLDSAVSDQYKALDKLYRNDSYFPYKDSYTKKEQIAPTKPIYATDNQQTAPSEEYTKPLSGAYSQEDVSFINKSFLPVGPHTNSKVNAKGKRFSEFLKKTTNSLSSGYYGKSRRI